MPPKVDSLTTSKPAVLANTSAAKSLTDLLENPPIKDYLILAAYCFLAAVAGPRFINNQVDGFLKDKQIKQLVKENTAVNNQNEKLSGEKLLEASRNQMLAAIDEKKAFQATSIEPGVAGLIKPQIKAPTVDDDPQKGRFGGNREVNERKLCADVESAGIPKIYKVKIWVESTKKEKPLDKDVVFYLHDTFRPSVLTICTNEFKDGKAKLETKLAWGAFTVGAVADNGMTLLEYDLAEDKNFPEDFRSR